MQVTVNEGGGNQIALGVDFLARTRADPLADPLNPAIAASDVLVLATIRKRGVANNKVEHDYL